MAPSNGKFADELYEPSVTESFDFELDARDRTVLFVSVVQGSAFSYDLTIETEATPGLPDDSSASDTLFDETSRSSDLVDTFIVQGGKVRIHGQTGDPGNELEIRARVHQGAPPLDADLRTDDGDGDSIRVNALIEHLASLPNLQDGDLTRLKSDADGRLIINKGTKDAGEKISEDVQRVHQDSAVTPLNGNTVTDTTPFEVDLTRDDPDGNPRSPLGADTIEGSIKLANGYDADLEFYETEDRNTLVRTLNIVNGIAAGTWTDFIKADIGDDGNLPSPHARLVITNTGSGDAALEGIVYMR